MTFQIRDGYGYGVILVSVELANELMPDATIDDTTTMGELRNQGALEQIHRNLLLPERYTVLGIFLQYYRFTWGVLVEAPIEECPRPHPGEHLPTIMPIYRMRPDGTKELVRLETEERSLYARILRPD